MLDVIILVIGILLVVALVVAVFNGFYLYAGVFLCVGSIIGTLMTGKDKKNEPNPHLRRRRRDEEDDD